MSMNEAASVMLSTRSVARLSNTTTAPLRLMTGLVESPLPPRPEVVTLTRVVGAAAARRSRTYTFLRPFVTSPVNSPCVVDAVNAANVPSAVIEKLTSAGLSSTSTVAPARTVDSPVLAETRAMPSAFHR